MSAVRHMFRSAADGCASSCAWQRCAKQMDTAASVQLLAALGSHAAACTCAATTLPPPPAAGMCASLCTLLCAGTIRSWSY